MKNRFLSLATQGVQKLTPYLPGKPIAELERELGITGSVKLASNENPLGPSPKAIKTIQNCLSSINYYPDGNGHLLCHRLASIHRVEPSFITLGNGSNDILELVARAFLTPDSSAVYSAYSFAVYPIVVQSTGARANIAAAYPENHKTMPFGHDPEQIFSAIDQNTKVVYIANPNNPTGTWLGIDELEALLQKIPDEIIMVLDLAYLEYMDKKLHINIKKFLDKYHNLVVTRTFSKVYALAGLRIGYSISHPDIAELLNRVRQPFNTNSIAQAAAIASLDDVEHINKSIKMNDEGKSYLQNQLSELALNYLPTMGNFIAVNMNKNATPIYEALLRKGIIVRPVSSYNMPNYLRITIGTQEQNDRMMKAFKEVLQ